MTTVISISPLPNPGWIQLTLFKPKCAVGLSRLLLQRRRELPMFNFLQEQAWTGYITPFKTVVVNKSSIKLCFHPSSSLFPKFKFSRMPIFNSTTWRTTTTEPLTTSSSAARIYRTLSLLYLSEYLVHRNTLLLLLLTKVLERTLDVKMHI